MDLNKGEYFLINTLREFDFLRKLKYEGSRFCIQGREFYVEFENHHIRQKVIIVFQESQEINILFSKKKTLGFIRKNVEEFSVFTKSSGTLEGYAKLLKENFEDILKGEKW